MTAPSAPTTWRNRIVGTGDEDPTQLLANPKNFVDGHLRVELALSRGEPSIPVSYVDLDDEEEAIVLASLDPLAGMAVTDQAKLEELLGEVALDNAALEAHLASPLPAATRPGLTDPDEVPEPPAESYVQRGDVWLLGDHRIMCGDSTQGADVDRLMAGSRARMTFTDPPWNVAIGRDKNPRHRQREGLANDDLDPAAFRAFLDGFASHMVRVTEGDVYCVLGASEWPTLDASLRSAGLHWSATIIWVKDAFVLGRSKYHRRYEPIWYGWPADRRSSFSAGRDLDDVWEFDRPRRSGEHPTMKPVKLVTQAIANSSQPGDLVYEPFSGSGTTIIAAETLGRRCHAMELEPRYVQVAIERWQAFTGKQAARG